MSVRRRDSAALEQELANSKPRSPNAASRRKNSPDGCRPSKPSWRRSPRGCVTSRWKRSIRPLPQADADERREALDRLDAEIARCRQMLADLQTREGAVRRELAEVHPDGTADSVASLAEQRATVGVLERLLDDLDAEVAGLARSHEPGRCIAVDAHGRMLPVAQMLRQQLYALCGQVTEQERAVRRVQLQAELRQLLARQTDLSEQLEHLLERRQSMVYETQLAGRVAASPPQAPAARHCQCERHEEFIRNADEVLLARATAPGTRTTPGCVGPSWKTSASTSATPATPWPATSPRSPRGGIVCSPSGPRPLAGRRSTNCEPSWSGSKSEINRACTLPPVLYCRRWPRRRIAACGRRPTRWPNSPAGS